MNKEGEQASKAGSVRGYKEKQKKVKKSISFLTHRSKKFVLGSGKC